MSVKRARESDDARPVSKVKKPRVDPVLVQIWEDLADVDEEVRLAATLRLVKSDEFDDPVQSKTIAKRLIRGLCSSRKAARLGFYVALVGCLTARKDALTSAGLDTETLTSMIESQTNLEMEASGQEQTDHFFGRLLACKALIETTFSTSDMETSTKVVQRTTDIISELIGLKPWLKNEACQILCSTMETIAAGKNLSRKQKLNLASLFLSELKSHKQLKTSEGICVWLRSLKVLPDIKLPHDVWSSGNPLHAKELITTKRILLDSRAQGTADEEQSLGTAGWSPRLHMAWPEVLTALNAGGKLVMPVAQFWSEVVDNGLFEPAATPERKYTGFLVLKQAFICLDTKSLKECFTKNLMATTISSLKSQDDAYLKRIAKDVFASLLHTENSEKSQAVVESLIRGINFADFDTLVGVSIVGDILENVPLNTKSGLGATIVKWMRQSDLDEKASKNIAIILQRSMTRKLTSTSRSESGDKANAITEAHDFAVALLETASAKQNAEETDGTPILIREKAYQILDSLLAGGPEASESVLEAIADSSTTVVSADEEITNAIDGCKRQLRALRKMLKSEESFVRGSPTVKFGTALMLAQVVHESSLGDENSAELLPDVEEMSKDVVKGKDLSKVADHIVDIVMSFMSRPTKYHRRLAELLFTSFAPTITNDGLSGIVEILNTSEGSEGQLNLFQTDGEQPDEETSSDKSSDSSELDSDVEIVEAESSDSEDSLGSDSEESDSASSVDEDSDADELTKFESALAAALGTRKLGEEDVVGTSADDDDESDSDMSDSDMMELDQKLAEVFKNQQVKTSANKERKQNLKMAKENVINLKNRSLDLVELFLRSQQGRALDCATLLSSCLQLAGQTTTQQLAQRAIATVKVYTNKVNRAGKLPKVEQTEEVRVSLKQHLSGLYNVLLGKDVSNAVLDVAAGLHIFYCKLLFSTDLSNFKETIEAICTKAGCERNTGRKSMLDFWSRYDAWLNSTAHHAG